MSGKLTCQLRFSRTLLLPLPFRAVTCQVWRGALDDDRLSRRSEINGRRLNKTTTVDTAAGCFILLCRFVVCYNAYRRNRLFGDAVQELVMYA